MRRVGIVGCEETKFTELGKQKAIEAIEIILQLEMATEVVSGGCHLGGIDIWAAEAGQRLGLKVTEFLPKTLNWSNGYKPRNLQIAGYSDVVYCLSVDNLPGTYKGMIFNLCYHCRSSDHVKSGGCWTTKEARKLGKPGPTIVIKQ